jgi:hypothetical protein
MKRVVALLLACLMAPPAWAQEPSSTPPVRVRITGVNTYEIPGAIKLDRNKVSGLLVRTTDRYVQFRRSEDGQVLTVLKPGQELTGRAKPVSDSLLEFLPDGEKETLFVPLDAIAKTESLERRLSTTSFAELPAKLRPGDTVYVLETQELQVAGRVVEISGSTLTVLVNGDRRAFHPSTTQEIWRRGDSLRNGLAIGAIGGLLAGGFLGGRNEGEEGSFFPAGGFLGTLIGAGLGAAVDAAFVGRQLVYRAPARPTARDLLISPVFSRSGASVTAVVRF